MHNFKYSVELSANKLNYKNLNTKLEMNYLTVQNQVSVMNKHISVKQPIAKLPAFSVLAEVFSYWGLNEDVCDLLHILSRKFNKYIKSNHRAMLMHACVQVSRTRIPAAGPFTVDKNKC